MKAILWMAVGVALVLGYQWYTTSPLLDLHRAAIAWDMNSAGTALVALERKGGCGARLAHQVRSEVATHGPTGLNKINQIQAQLWWEHRCPFPPLWHVDQVEVVSHDQ
jgi:hypothetical protein